MKHWLKVVIQRELDKRQLKRCAQCGRDVRRFKVGLGRHYLSVRSGEAVGTTNLDNARYVECASCLVDGNLQPPAWARR